MISHIGEKLFYGQEPVYVMTSIIAFDKGGKLFTFWRKKCDFKELLCPKIDIHEAFLLFPPN